VHGCRWTQAASGAAGRASVGLCHVAFVVVVVVVVNVIVVVCR